LVLWFLATTVATLLLLVISLVTIGYVCWCGRALYRCLRATLVFAGLFVVSYVLPGYLFTVYLYWFYAFGLLGFVFRLLIDLVYVRSFLLPRSRSFRFVTLVCYIYGLVLYLLLFTLRLRSTLLRLVFVVPILLRWFGFGCCWTAVCSVGVGYGFLRLLRCVYGYFTADLRCLIAVYRSFRCPPTLHHAPHVGTDLRLPHVTSTFYPHVPLLFTRFTVAFTFYTTVVAFTVAVRSTFLVRTLCPCGWFCVRLRLVYVVVTRDLVRLHGSVVVVYHVTVDLLRSLPVVVTLLVGLRLVLRWLLITVLVR